MSKNKNDADQKKAFTEDHLLRSIVCRLMHDQTSNEEVDY
ncbi:hypothetical protein B4134_0142 [Bacillus safensis]|nr:hypothetical protein B4134_0142 [Bacillus safensis]